MKKSFEIESDCLDIIKRIKAVDEDYFVVFNMDKKKFELHNKSQGGNTYCLTFPFNILDERAVTLVLKTRVQNSDALFEEMQRENEKQEKDNIKKIWNDFKETLYDS
mgnify:FL=1